MGVGATSRANMDNYLSTNTRCSCLCDFPEPVRTRMRIQMRMLTPIIVHILTYALKLILELVRIRARLQHVRWKLTRLATGIEIHTV